MEELLFYDYLNFQKKCITSFEKRLLKFPKKVLCIFFLSVLALFVAIISIFIGVLKIELIAVMIEILSCWVLEYALEKYKISNSKERILEYSARCLELKNWLISNSIEDNEDICEIKKRIERHIATYKEEQKVLTERIDKWLQMLVVPLTILIITYTINQTYSLKEKTSYVVSTLLLFTLLYGFICIIKNASRFIKKQRIEQMTYFVADLQGVLDLDTFGVKVNYVTNSCKKCDS